ncbi:hypothetical protein, variant [Saprolegnia diclina VS20]|nr:hypothetical protein, variant [Saprolegnia diclina VS20]EQC41407.1 hypothetical protein, variant [Saprolegnia diclina VS20]|eukprot:XP_008605121.1 hypothetical protein, variant [Saprolegnia diclina VS20]
MKQHDVTAKTAELALDPEGQYAAYLEDEMRFFQESHKIPLGCVKDILRSHYRSLRTLKHVLKPPPPPLSVQLEKLSPPHIEILTAPIRDICDQLTHMQFNISIPTAAEVTAMGKDVFYYKLWEAESISMGIFFMPPGSKIPLHDHPFMSVVTRVLYGSFHLKAYNLLEHDQVDDQGAPLLLAKQTRNKHVTAPCTMDLNPWQHNLHELVAEGAIGCAVFDVTIPPYDDLDRHGNHYKVIKPQEDMEDVFVLQTTEGPHA